MPKVQVAEKLLPLILTPKRIKIAVGGRGASKSIAFADVFLKFCDDGERLMCAREFQNSIDESVHALMLSRIIETGSETLRPTAKTVVSDAGGEIFYRGLARNLLSLKSTFGVDRVWIEEAQSLSQETIDILFPTIREEGSEIWMSMNRGSSQDPVSQAFLSPYEAELERHGFYEDEEIMIVQINWQDNPWFPEVLNQQRVRDKRIMSRAKYDNIWGGKTSDTIENAIIEPEWFDACIDAHKKLGFRPIGREMVVHDCSDGQKDPASYMYQWGNVVLELGEKIGQINDVCDWAVEQAIDTHSDMFIWDGDGMGVGLRAQVKKAFRGKGCAPVMFKGSEAASQPEKIYEPMDGEVKKPVKNKAAFTNKRAQFYWYLRDRMFKTYLAVERGEYINPEELISFSSEMALLSKLRAELCRIPRKPGSRIQILSKPEMAKPPLRLPSPNLADVVMMGQFANYVQLKNQNQSAGYSERRSAAGWT